MPKKRFIANDYTIKFHESASVGYQPIVGNYDVTENVQTEYQGESWQGSQGVSAGDFPRYTAFSSSFENRWIQPFSGSDDWDFIRNIEATRWDKSNTVEWFDRRTAGVFSTHHASVGYKTKFTRDGKLYTSRASRPSAGFEAAMPMGILEYASSSTESRWKINDFIPAGTASFSTVPPDKQRLFYSISNGSSTPPHLYNHMRTATGHYNIWDIVDVDTPDVDTGQIKKEKCAVIQSDARYWIDRDDHTLGAIPGAATLRDDGGSGFGTQNGHGWQYLIYKSSSDSGWYQETILDPQDLEEFQFAKNENEDRINDRDNANNNWSNESGNGLLWVSSSAYGRTLGTQNHAKTVLAYTASHDGKLRVAGVIGPHSSAYVNKFIIVHVSSSVGGWSVEDFVYAGNTKYTDMARHDVIAYHQNRNEFYISQFLSSDAGRDEYTYIQIISSASSGVYYTPGTVELSSRGGYINSTQNNHGHLANQNTSTGNVFQDINNSTETRSKKTDRLCLRELGLSNNLGAEWNNLEEWQVNHGFGAKLRIDDDGRVFVPVYGEKLIFGTENEAGDRKSAYNKVFILNNSIQSSLHPDYDPLSSSTGWYIEDTLIDYDYTAGGVLSDKDHYWYADQNTGFVDEFGATRRKYLYSGFGTTIAVPQFQERTRYLFVGAPLSFSDNHDTLLKHASLDHEPRGCGYLYKSSSHGPSGPGSAGGWSLAQKFENPTNFLSGSPDRSNFHVDDALQYEESAQFTSIATPNRPTYGGFAAPGSGQNYWISRASGGDNGFGMVSHGFSGSVLAVGNPARLNDQNGRAGRHYPFENVKVTTQVGEDYATTGLLQLVESGSGGGQIIIYDGNAQYETTTTRETTRTVNIVDGPVPTRVGNVKGAFNVRGQEGGSGSYRVSIGDKKK